MNKRLEEAKAHAWRRWKREYICSLMGGRRLNKEGGATPVVAEVNLVVGDEKNRGEWKKGKALRLIQGKDGVVRVVILLHKEHTIERPPQLVCPLEIRGMDHSLTCRREGETKCSRGIKECGYLQLNRQLKGLQCRFEQKRRTKTDLFTSCMIFC